MDIGDGCEDPVEDRGGSCETEWCGVRESGLYKGIKMEEKSVVYASDEKFVEILAVSMESLMQYNSGVTIYVLNNGINSGSVDKLIAQAEQHDAKIKIIPVEDLNRYVGRKLSCQKKITHTCYFRLFLSEIMPNDVDRVLYLDCDTLVCDNLDEIFEWDLKSMCAGVAEPTSKLMKKKINLKAEDSYMNSGIMLINLKKWRTENISKKFVDYIEEMKGKISFEDQGCVNHVLKGRMDLLPIRYNIETQYFDFGYDGFQMMKRDKIRYSCEEVKKAMENPGIIHFTNSFASERPWVKYCTHKYVNEWRECKNKTAWKNSDEWESNKDFIRKISRWIYQILPQRLKNHFIYFINGVIRPLIEN